MRVFLFISCYGISWPMVQRVTEEGHRAILYINEKDCRRIANGLVEKHEVKEVLVDEEGNLNKEVLNSLLKPVPDCIVFDMVNYGYGKAADILRKKGYPVIGGSEWQDKVELDRLYGAKVMKTLGIKTPETIAFTDYDKAIKFVEAQQKIYVFKPQGNQGNMTTYVAQGPDDLIGMLEFYKTRVNEEFQLQEKKDGVEISSEIWFNGKEVINSNFTMEEKALMEGGKGPKTGCMGSVVWNGDTTCRLFKEGVGRLVPLLRKLKYIGCIDLNAIVDKENVWGLEFTARFGYDAIYIFMEMMKGRINDLLYGVATGVTRTIEFKSSVGMGVLLAVPPYPDNDGNLDLYKDVLIQGLNPQILKHFWGDDIYKKGEDYLLSGNGGRIATITARGDDVSGYSPIRDAKRRVYRTINNIIIPDVMYRSDIGDRVQGDKEKLKNWGWIK